MVNVALVPPAPASVADDVSGSGSAGTGSADTVSFDTSVTEGAGADGVFGLCSTATALPNPVVTETTRQSAPSTWHTAARLDVGGLFSRPAMVAHRPRLPLHRRPRVFLGREPNFLGMSYMARPCEYTHMTRVDHSRTRAYGRCRGSEGGGALPSPPPSACLSGDLCRLPVLDRAHQALAHLRRERGQLLGMGLDDVDAVAASQADEGRASLPLRRLGQLLQDLGHL